MHVHMGVTRSWLRDIMPFRQESKHKRTRTWEGPGWRGMMEELKVFKIWSLYFNKVLVRNSWHLMNWKYLPCSFYKCKHHGNHYTEDIGIFISIRLFPVSVMSFFRQSHLVINFKNNEKLWAPLAEIFKISELHLSKAIKNASELSKNKF